MGICSSKNNELDNRIRVEPADMPEVIPASETRRDSELQKEIDKEQKLDENNPLSNTAHRQRRRLSVTPHHVGDITKANVEHNREGDNLHEQRSLTEMRVIGKSQTGFVPYNAQKVNQDRFLAMNGIPNYSDVALFAVMDGHGDCGQHVSSYVKEKLPIFIGKQKNLKTHPEEALVSAVEELARNLARQHPRINTAFSGTTLVFMARLGNTLYVGNVGDSRCVMCQYPAPIEQSTEEKTVYVLPIALDLSVDQKPSDELEKKRILSRGGRVCPLPGYEEHEDAGPDRVWLGEIDVPGLAMSRSIGDKVAHTVGVISTPVITSHELKQEDAFCILASDGVWEFMSSLDAVQLIDENKDNLSKAAHMLVDESTKRWKEREEVVDDITAVVVTFGKLTTRRGSVKEPKQ